MGCGTGVLAHTLLELSSPASVVGVDPEVGQIAQASRGPAAGRATFEVADARSLPFPDGSFHIAVSALVLNFIGERSQAMAEKRRVTCAGGGVAAYVWDFAQELSPSGPLRRAMRLFGVDLPAIPGTAESRIEALRTLFEQAGLEGIETRTIDVFLAYVDFEDFWQAQTPSYSPTTNIIASMTDSERMRLARGRRPPHGLEGSSTRQCDQGARTAQHAFSASRQARLRRVRPFLSERLARVQAITGISQRATLTRI